MPDTPAHRAPRMPQMLGRLGLYSTYVAAALFLITIAGDLAVLVRHALLQGWLALLVGVGPLMALLLSTLASYINYYGVWRIVRGKDVYDAQEDLKSHAADAPQAAQALLAGRAGCLPAAATTLLFLSLMLVLTTLLPQQTPLVGALGDWNARVGDLALVPGATTPAAPAPTSVAPTATSDIAVTPTPTAAPKPTATAKGGKSSSSGGAAPGPTATPALVPSPTPTPIIVFSISPKSATSYSCIAGAPPASVTITLNNSGSAVPVSWSANISQSDSAGNPWATISPSRGVVPAGGQQTITLYPDGLHVCPPSGSDNWLASIAASGAGTYTFTYTIVGPTT